MKNIIALVLILAISAVASYQVFVKNNQDRKEILSVSPSSTPSPTLTPTSTPSPKPTTSNNSNNTQVTIKQEVKDNSLTSQAFNLSDFKYPNSSQISSFENGINLESSDYPSTITDWYEEKIRSLGFKSKSFVKTSSNENILNKLVAASGTYEIRIEIEKSANSAKVSIKVTLTLI